MDYYIIGCILVVAVIIILMWYHSTYYYSIPDTTILDLSTEDDSLVGPWYAEQIKPSFNFEIDPEQVGAELITQLLKPEAPIDPETVVVGIDLAAHAGPSDQVFDLRSRIGIPAQIAIIHDQRVRARLRRLNSLDLARVVELRSILDLKLGPIAQDYLQKVLDDRWAQILKVNDPLMLNRAGSYIYLRECSIPNVKAATVDGRKRLNLLCSDLEFKTLLQRWTRVLKTPAPQTIPEEISSEGYESDISAFHF
jgi:hypothetical protein